MIDPQDVLEAMRPMLSEQAAMQLPAHLPHHLCPRKKCGGYLNHRGTIEGRNVWECQTCRSPYIDAVIVQDLVELSAEPLAAPLRAPQRAAPNRRKPEPESEAATK